MLAGPSLCRSCARMVGLQLRAWAIGFRNPLESPADWQGLPLVQWVSPSCRSGNWPGPGCSMWYGSLPLALGHNKGQEHLAVLRRTAGPRGNRARIATLRVSLNPATPDAACVHSPPLCDPSSSLFLHAWGGAKRNLTRQGVLFSWGTFAPWGRSRSIPVRYFPQHWPLTRVAPHPC